MIFLAPKLQKIACGVCPCVTYVTYVTYEIMALISLCHDPKDLIGPSFSGPKSPDTCNYRLARDFSSFSGLACHRPPKTSPPGHSHVMARDGRVVEGERVAELGSGGPRVDHRITSVDVEAIGGPDGQREERDERLD
uniref:Uncharacterized protein n=1 Tax=Steinernema glaseri TaxID=37863 RepID=A0A1I7Z8D8_9BILA